MEHSRGDENPPIGRLIAVPLIARILIDTGTQAFYPFLPFLAQGMGLTTIRLGQILGFRNLTGLISPLVGFWADRHGYRRFMQVQLMLGGLGFLAIAVPRLPIQMAGLFLSGLALFSFLPILQAYLSARLPYKVRARGIGIVEYSWAIAGIAGLSTVGWVIQQIGWQTPFIGLGTGMFLMALLFGTLSRSHRVAEAVPAPAATHDPPGHRTVGTVRAGEVAPAAFVLAKLRRFLGSKAMIGSVLATIGVGWCTFFALLNVAFIYGDWLMSEYGLNAGAMGVVSLLIGLLDLVGSGLASLFSDRIGKKRALLGGHLLAILAFFLMPLLNVSVTGSVGSLLILRSILEFSIVTFLAFASEQAPARRGRMLSLVNAVSLTGGSLAGFTGPWLYRRMGIAGPSWMGLSGMVLACLLNVLFLREISAAEADDGT